MSVSRIGTATGTNTATVPAHNIGDLIVIAAFRNTTGTPSLPAGYTSILTKTGTTSSMRVGFKIATTTSDTAGTWTNATALVCHVYRSSNYGTGGSLFPGASASSSSTNNTVNYPALTLLHADSTSWVLGFGGVSNLTETIVTAPSGMTNQSLETAAATQAAGHDTNGAVSSWSSTNAVTTGTAGNSVSATVELIENQPGTAVNNFVQHISFSYNNVNSTSEVDDHYVYTLPPALANNCFVVAVTYPSGVTPVLTDNLGNTWPAVGVGAAGGSILADDGAGNFALAVFVLPSSAAALNQITIDFGGNPVGPVQTKIMQLFGVTGTINAFNSATGVSVSGGILSPGAVVPTVDNCLILSFLASTTNVSTNPALIVPETGYQLLDADLSFASQQVPNASQFALQGAKATTTPRFYINAGGTVETYNLVAIALTTGTQGTLPATGPGTAPWISKILHFGVNGNPAKWFLQIPSVGNCQLFTTFYNAPGQTVTSVADNDGVTWTLESGSPGSLILPIRTGSVGRSSRTVTWSITGTGGNGQAIFYDVSNCDPTSPVDVVVGATTAGTNQITNAPSITPSGANRLTIAYQQLGIGPSYSVSAPVGAVYGLPTAQAWKGTASIAGTTLTIGSTTWGAFNIGDILTDAGSHVSAGCSIDAGSGTSWTVSPSQGTVASETMFLSGSDTATLTWGNCAGHFYNGSDLSTQNWTWNIRNGGGLGGAGGDCMAIILKGPAATAVVLDKPRRMFLRR